jgi:alpha-amylase
MAVMMQAFYWDAPVKENKQGEWWNHVAEQVPQLAAAGINTLWLPPFSKCANATSNGYDPYDYFDLGDFEQKGSTKTAYGNRAELERLIQLMRQRHIERLRSL